MSIDWPVVAEAKFFKNHARYEQALDAFLDLVREMDSGFSGDRLDESAGFVVQMRVGRTRHDVIQIICNRAHVFRDRPFVVVEHHDETLGVRFHIVERFVTDSARERGIARNHHHVIAPAAQIAPHRHAECSRKRRPGVTRAVAIVLAFRAQEKTVETAVLPHCGETIETASEHFVHVTLVAHVHDKAIARRVEDAMQRDRQFDYAEIRTKMPAGLR